MCAANGKTAVLVIDDEVQIRRLVRACLEKNNYEVREASTGEEGITASIQAQPNMIILDLGLPDMDGMVVLHRLREWSNVPIVVLSVRDRDRDKVTALDDGANDYLTKPFSTDELLARLRVLQRNLPSSPKSTLWLTSGCLQVDLVNRTVRVRGQALKLARTEYALLLFFCPTCRPRSYTRPAPT